MNPAAPELGLDISPAAPCSRGRRMQLVLMAAGAVLFGVVVWRANPRQLWSTLSAFGAALLLFIALDGASDIFHALATRYCFSPENRRAPLLSLLYIRFTGRAYNFLIPASGFGGDMVKAMLLRRYAPAHEAASVMIIDKFTFGITQFAMAFWGSAVVITQLDIPLTAKVTFWVLSMLLWLGFVGFLLLQRRGWLTPLLQRVAQSIGSERGRAWIAQNLAQLDDRLQTFYRQQRLDLLRAIFWQGLGTAIDIVVAWLFLFLLVGTSDWMKAIAIWSLSNWFDMMIFFVPGGLGTQELSRAFIFQAIHYQWSEGVVYAIVLRTNQLVWSMVGLITHAIELRSAPAADAARASSIVVGQ